MNLMILKIVTLSRAHFGPIGETGEPVLRQTVWKMDAKIKPDTV